MRSAVAIRHVHFEDCGTLGHVLRERDIALRYVEAGSEPLNRLNPSEADLLVGLGGPVSVYDSDRYPWISDELSLVSRWLDSRKPIVGICLGAQMLAAALGARVYPGPKELGWGPLRLSPEGAASVIAPLAAAPAVLHWHGDTFDLPPGARLLASSAAVPNQIYQWDSHVLALQCHVEITGASIESWLIGHAVEIAASPDASPATLRADTRRFAPLLEAQARRIFGAWLDEVGL